MLWINVLIHLKHEYLHIYMGLKQYNIKHWLKCSRFLYVRGTTVDVTARNSHVSRNINVRMIKCAKVYGKLSKTIFVMSTYFY